MVHKGRELLNACYFGNLKMATRLLSDPGCPADWHDPRDGWTGIHYAARWGHVPLLRVLLNRGVDINVRTMDKDTPLHHACRSHKFKACVFLMSRGAVPTLLNHSGDRPSALAADEEIRFVCDHFETYRARVRERTVLTSSSNPTSSSKPTSYSKPTSSSKPM